MRMSVAVSAALMGVLCPACLDLGRVGSKGTPNAGPVTWDGTAEPYTLPPDECMPSAATFSAMQRLHDDNEAKVHELVKCGGLQTSMSRNLIIVIVASNRGLFDQASYDELVAFARGYGVELQIPFNRDTDGRWTLPINAATNSVFTVRFHDSAHRAVLQDDPFVIDSYLTGVTAASSLTIAEMKQHLTWRNEITFSWQEPGPLAHELNRGNEIPNPFSIRISFADLAQFVWGLDLSTGDPDLGPLDSVMDLNVDSEVVVHDSIGNTDVEYEVEGLAGTLREVSANGVSFDVKHIVATNGSYRQEGSATELRYAAGPGTLVGRFDYRIRGPEGDLSVSDIYDSSTGLRVAWSCPK